MARTRSVSGSVRSAPKELGGSRAPEHSAAANPISTRCASLQPGSPSTRSHPTVPSARTCAVKRGSRQICAAPRRNTVSTGEGATGRRRAVSTAVTVQACRLPPLSSAAPRPTAGAHRLGLLAQPIDPRDQALMASVEVGPDPAERFE